MPIGTYLHNAPPTSLRGVLMLALSETGSFLTPSVSSDIGGGATQTWTAGASVPCRIDPIGGNYGPTTGDRLDEASTHMVTVPPGTQVSSDWRFAIVGRGTFEITGVRHRTDEMAGEFEVAAA